MKKWKKRLLTVMIYVFYWGMWTNLIVWGFMTASTLN